MASSINLRKEESFLALIMAAQKCGGQELRVLEAAHALDQKALDGALDVLRRFAEELRKLDAQYTPLAERIEKSLRVSAATATTI